MAIDFEMHGAVALITINRPEQMNSLDAEAYRQLSEAWIRVRDDSDVRAAVVTGAGSRSFCAGADIKTFMGVETPLGEFWLTQRDQLVNRGLEIWKPIVAAVNGYCLGGGMTLMLATDIRLAAPHATFALSEVKRGVIAANGGTQRILDQLPYPLGMEMLLTGDPWDAATAERWGLVNRVVDADSLVDEAMTLGSKLAANAPLAVQASKELAVRARDVDQSTGFRMEQAILATLRRSKDVQEGVTAFKEKRQPHYTGE